MDLRQYRGKYSREHKWVYGYFYHYYDGSLHSIITNIDDDEMQSNTYPIDLGSVGICTGVKDKKGCDIYEGDFLVESDSENGISGYYPVVYNNKTASFCIDNSYYKDHSHLVDMVSYFGLNDLEVAGNIYDNPERLPNNRSPFLEGITNSELEF